MFEKGGHMICNILPEDFRMEAYEPLQGESDHTIFSGDERIEIHTAAEDFPFYDEAGRMEAVLTTMSFLRKTRNAQERPVMFIWDGGPGSATSSLLLECFGPWRKSRNPGQRYELTEEADNILDICDLVFMDPAGVGYSRLLNPDKKAKYWSVDGDARSCAFALTEWLRRHGRLGSPLYICGESYGTIRACRVVAELGVSPASESRMMLGLPVAGVIMIGMATSPRGREGFPLEPGMESLTAALPTMAAVNWYHHHDRIAAESSFRTQDEFVEAAWRLGAEEVFPARFYGSCCPDERTAEISGKLAFFTGMDREYFVQSQLTLCSTEDFATRVTADEGDRVGVYDATKRCPLREKFNQMGDRNEGIIYMNREMTEKMGIRTNRMYYTANITLYYPWDYSTENLGQDTRTHLDCLSDAMQKNRSMKLLVAGGRYDLLTLVGNTRFALMHSRIPKEQVTVREYYAGHGVYSSEEGRSQFLKDVRHLIGDAGAVCGQ